MSKYDKFESVDGWMFPDGHFDTLDDVPNLGTKFLCRGQNSDLEWLLIVDGDYACETGMCDDSGEVSTSCHKWDGSEWLEITLEAFNTRAVKSQQSYDRLW